MRGLTLIGLGAPAAADAVAAALAADVPGAAVVGLPALETEATPLVAARHEGVALDPAGLAATARAAEVAIVALWGGVLAPLTPRYSVRDLARELDLPVVVVLPAVGRLAGYGLAALDAVRGAGLAPVATVVPGWPEPPPRVLQDERELLAELSGLPVEVLPSGGGAADWPVGAWLGGGAGGAPAHVALEPYAAWAGTAPGDPRDTPRPQLMATLLEIIAAEGPMLASRAYAVYARAAGGRKLTSVARAPLSSSVYWLAKEGRVELRRAEEAPWQGEDLVRVPDAPEVRLRELGPRTLEEVPLDEIAALVRGLAVTASAAEDRTPAKRAVLARYGLVRLTGRADAYLERALDLAARP